MTPKIAVIIFPGTNCDLETVRACRWAGMSPEIIRWNEDSSKLKKFDGFILPGGFSYEDRGRSGVIASKDKILKTIMNEAAKGKPLIGICNGAQILIEAGLIPGISYDIPEMALAWNERTKKEKILGVGFYNEWIYIRSGISRKTAFNRFDPETIMRIPIAHGEGRFVTQNKSLQKELIQNQQNIFRYCSPKGKIIDEFPVNPNGSSMNLAGVCNKEGNILALMPHPERTKVGLPVFASIADYIKSNSKPKIIKIKALKPKIEQVRIPKIKEKPDILIKVELIITDNEERTIENTMKRKGFKDLKLKRQILYAVYTKKGVNLQKTASTLIRSGELLNLNKETPLVEIGDKNYIFNKEEGLQEVGTKTVNGKNIFVLDFDNFKGKKVYSQVKHYFKENEIKKIESGVHWTIDLKTEQQIKKLIGTYIFHNPHSAKILAI
jgi:phosphoribosylformylglycinamidine synthase I